MARIEQMTAALATAAEPSNAAGTGHPVSLLSWP